MAEGNLTTAIKHVAVVTSQRLQGEDENGEKRPYNILSEDSVVNEYDKISVQANGTLFFYGDRIYIFTIDSDTTNKLRDGQKYYFKWDKIGLKQILDEEESIFPDAKFNVSVIQWSGEISRSRDVNGVFVAKLHTISSGVDDGRNGGTLTFTYHKDANRPCIALLINTGEEEEGFDGSTKLYVWYGSDTTLNLSESEPPRPKPPKPEPPVHHEEDTGGITVSGTNARRINSNTYRSEVKYYSSDAKCILKIPDRILKPSTTYSVKFTLKSGEGLDEFSTGVKFYNARISSSANKQGDTYTMTFSTPAVLDANAISFYALGSFVKWDSHGSNYFEIQNFQITPADEHVTPPVPEPPKSKTKPKFDASMEVPYPPTISKWGLWRLKFRNIGDVTLHNATMVCKLPAGLKPMTDPTASKGEFTGSLDGGIVFSEVKAGEEVGVYFYAAAEPSKLKYGSNELTTTVSATTKELAREDESLLGNNTVKVTVVYPKPEPPKPKPNFDLKLQPDKTTIKVGETVKLTATFTNTGNTVLNNATVTTTLPSGMTLVGSIESAAKLTGDVQQGVKLPVVSVGDSAAFSFSVKPNAELLKFGDNELPITISASTDELREEPDKSNNTVKIVVNKPEPKFDVAIKASEDTVDAGGNADYTITFNNTGTADLHNVVITSKLPTGLKLVDGSLKSAAKFTGSVKEGISLSEVKAGNKIELTFTVIVELNEHKQGEEEIAVTVDATAKELAHEGTGLISNNTAKITAIYPKPKLRPEEVREVKLANNEILDDNRRELIKPIFEAVKGLKFTPLEITTEGHGWYEIGDRIAIENGKEQWQAVITNIKLTIDGGIKEEIKSIAPTATTTNYALAGGIKKTIYNTEIKVDKQKQEIEQIVSRQDKQDTAIHESYTKIRQDITGVTTTIQETGGGNIIYNSVGFDTDNKGKFTDWETQGTALGQASPESLAAGALSGNQIVLSKGTKITQRVLVTRNSYYSLSFRVKKGALGVAEVSLTNDVDKFVVTMPEGKDEYWVEHKLAGIKPSINYFDVTVSLNKDVSLFAITDLMLNAGNSTMPWVQASGETLNTKVSVTKHGLKVKSNIHNGDYVEMTPLEFAGYSTVSGSLQRVFSLNRDTTTVQKLSAVQRISMPPIMIVPIKSGEQAGWSFVKTE